MVSERKSLPTLAHLDRSDWEVQAICFLPLHGFVNRVLACTHRGLLQPPVSAEIASTAWHLAEPLGDLVHTDASLTGHIAQKILSSVSSTCCEDQAPSLPALFPLASHKVSQLPHLQHKISDLRLRMLRLQNM